MDEARFSKYKTEEAEYRRSGRAPGWAREPYFYRNIGDILPEQTRLSEANVKGGPTLCHQVDKERVSVTPVKFMRPLNMVYLNGDQ